MAGEPSAHPRPAMTEVVRPGEISGPAAPHGPTGSTGPLYRARRRSAGPRHRSRLVAVPCGQTETCKVGSLRRHCPDQVMEVAFRSHRPSSLSARPSTNTPRGASAHRPGPSGRTPSLAPQANSHGTLAPARHQGRTAPELPTASRAVTGRDAQRSGPMRPRRMICSVRSRSLPAARSSPAISAAQASMAAQSR